MGHRPSQEDISFRNAFEAADIAPEAFDHEAHLRVAYTYLSELGPKKAFERFRDVLSQFLARHGVDPSKYHATLTEAWILAVWHFMSKTPSTSSFRSFLDANKVMLDSKIMLSHYSEKVLQSEKARQEFVEPDLEPIPRHER